MLNYSLHENPLTERKDDFTAQAHPSASYNRDQFIELMLQRGSMVTKTDIVAVLNAIEETAAYIIRNGGTISLPVMNTSFSISGVFESPMDTFDPHRHKLHVNIRKGTVVRDAEAAVKLSKITAAVPQPQILEVKDSVSGKVDEILTSGGAVEINGIHIKITGTNEATGLWFVAEDGTETQAVTIITNKPAQIIALIPPLTAGGVYRVKIATQYAGGKDLKEPRTTVFDKALTVE
jgi:hypothetical protein